MHYRSLLGVLALARSSAGAGSYDILPFERLTSDHRVIIGVPGDDINGHDSERVTYRRKAIEKAVADHVERAAANSDSIALDSIQYGFVGQMEAAFPELFPRHTKLGAKAAGKDLILTPALKLINVRTKELMYPDYDILLADLPAELDRLVADYERWQQQTGSASVDPADGALVLHGKNFAPAVGAAQGGMVALFYAPWCHYSKLMLPKFAGAAALVAGWESEGSLVRGRVSLGKVNVDEEAELRGDYNVTTYPQLRVVRGGKKARKATRDAQRKREAADALGHKQAVKEKHVLPFKDFTQPTGSAADIAAHAVSTLGWASGQPYAILATTDPNGDLSSDGADRDKGDTAAADKELALADGASRFTRLANAVDKALAAAGEEIKGSPPPEEGEPGLGEPSRAVVVLAVFPGPVPHAARHATCAALAAWVGGANVLVGCGGPSEASEALVHLFHQPGTEDHDQAFAAEASKGLVATAQSRHGGVLVVSAGGGAPLFATFPSSLAAAPTPVAALALLKAYDPSAKKAAVGVDAHGGAAAVASFAGDDAGFADAGAFGHWVKAAAWPLVSRFSTSAAQGERLRASGTSTLAVLVGDEGDFVFGSFVEALEGAARARLGEAHFLFADLGEPRIAGLLRSARATLPTPGGDPVLVLVSMAGRFQPLKLEGGRITARNVEALLDQASAAADAQAAQAAEAGAN